MCTAKFILIIHLLREKMNFIVLMLGSTATKTNNIIIHVECFAVCIYISEDSFMIVQLKAMQTAYFILTLKCSLWPVSNQNLKLSVKFKYYSQNNISALHICNSRRRFQYTI